MVVFGFVLISHKQTTETKNCNSFQVASSFTYFGFQQTVLSFCFFQHAVIHVNKTNLTQLQAERAVK